VCLCDHLTCRDGDRLLKNCPYDALVTRGSGQTSVVPEVGALVAWQQIGERKRPDRYIFICIIITEHHDHQFIIIIIINQSNRHYQNSAVSH